MLSPVKAFWAFVKDVDYQGANKWGPDDAIRLANAYTLRELWMFQNMCDHYSNSLAVKLYGARLPLTDSAEYKISAIICGGPKVTAHYLSLDVATDAERVESELDDIKELESFGYLFQDFDPIQWAMNGIPEYLLKTPAFSCAIPWVTDKVERDHIFPVRL